MSGKVTVTVELNDGMKIEYASEWNGGNPAFEGAESEKSAILTAGNIRRAIEATHGRLPENAVFTPAGGK